MKNDEDLGFLDFQDLFLKKYKISEELFLKTNLNWGDLITLAKDFLKHQTNLESIGSSISNALMKVKRVHSVKFRVKDTEHLIAKIIRKRISDPGRIIDINNYLQEVTDLVGVRVLHLFKEEVKEIHSYLIDTYELKEHPIAYVRDGDSTDFLSTLKGDQFNIKKHPRSYRSLHYLPLDSFGKTNYIAEVQVRTIFEEGWSEIDHIFSYPNNVENQIYTHFLSILNRLAGSADEMGAFIKQLHKQFKTLESRHESEILKKNKVIEDLKEEINQLKISSEERKSLEGHIKNLEASEMDKLGDALNNPFNGLAEQLQWLARTNKRKGKQIQENIKETEKPQDGLDAGAVDG